MDGPTFKFLNVIDEFSRVSPAIRYGRRCKAVDVIVTIEELLKGTSKDQEFHTYSRLQNALRHQKV